MADIELVIKIPQEQYDTIKSDLYNTFPAEMKERGLEAIRNGTPLPRGHGKLMILSKDKLKENQMKFDFSCQKWISEVGLSKATIAIIEADKDE